MPIKPHPSFSRPTVAMPLWRYMDLPKFVALITSRKLWLSNVEILARDDPYEGLNSAFRFPHRIWKTFAETPPMLQAQIMKLYGKDGDGSQEAAFRSFVMLQEQHCIFSQYGRRDYYVNCWHGAEHESVAMWKIYGSPGPGLAIKSNGGRLEQALSACREEIYLGAVSYQDPRTIRLGASNALDDVLLKRSNFSYEQEFRLVHWDTTQLHDPLINDKWNEETMQFDDLVEDLREIAPGLALDIDITTLISEVVISPFAPPWYKGTIEGLRDQLGHSFPVSDSHIMATPFAIT